MIKNIRTSLILWISFCIPGMTATFIETNAQLSLNDRGVVKVDDDMYVGVKRLPYKENTYRTDRRAGRTPQIGHDNVYFVFERLTEKNYNFWKYFIDKQREDTSRVGVTSESGKSVLFGDGVNSFKTSLGHFGRYPIWIAYVTRKDPRVMRALTPVEYRSDIPWDKTKWPADKKEEYKEYNARYDAYIYAEYEFEIGNDDIEMTFTVFADDRSPITTHMGIFRNYKYFLSEMKPHLDLAMELHGFAGFASKLAYPHVEYMVTKPANKMQ